MTGISLLGAVQGVAAIDTLIDDDSIVAAMVATEVALLRACERADLVPAGTASRLDDALTGTVLDVAQLSTDSVAAGNPVVPLVRRLLALAPEAARPWVHHGATSQDILDTALMLVAARVCDAVLDQLDVAVTATATLADRHRGSLQVGRTLGQQAVPTTFGVTAAGWALGIDAARQSIRQVRRERLAVQLGGAAGTLGVYGPAGMRVVEALAVELDLNAPPIPWHTERSRIRDLAAALASTVAAAGKVATDVVALASTEVAELAEGGGSGHGGSSAMPHKRNPIDSVLVRAAAIRAPGLLAALYTASLQEHQRGAGGWHAEWQPLLDLFSLAGGTAARLGTLLVDLDVDADRMAATLAAGQPAIMAENLTTTLKPHVGRGPAQEMVAGALEAADEAEVVASRLAAETGLDEAQLRAALAPLTVIASCGPIIDSALRALGQTGRQTPA